MTRKNLIAAALFAVAASSAFAGGEFDPLRDYQLPTVESKLTRAEVKAETARAIAAGEVRNQRDDRVVTIQRNVASNVSREAVREEASTALRAPRGRAVTDFAGS